MECGEASSGQPRAHGLAPGHDMDGARRSRSANENDAADAAADHDADDVNNVAEDDVEDDEVQADDVKDGEVQADEVQADDVKDDDEDDTAEDEVEDDRVYLRVSYGCAGFRLFSF